ncbi:MAG: RDD family protein [Alphaproteobacteria bacterium]|nr:RDD family protein [Alphaproteobacteria bacterium]
MSNSNQSGRNYSNAYDPSRQPELFEGVVTRRAIAFVIDIIVIAIPVVLACLLIAVFGLFTLGLGWALFLLVWPATVVWALVYYGSCIGGPHSATLGMRAMELELRTWYGAPGYFVLGAAHGLLFWLSMSLTPFVVLIALFNRRRRLGHDFVLGTVVINNPHHAALPQLTRTS